MFERFTHEARTLVVQARLEAYRLGHGFTGCEHLLLVAAADTGPTGDVLRSLGATPAAVEAAALHLLGTPGEALDRDALAAIGIDLDRVRQKVEAVFGVDALASGSPPGRTRWGRRSRTGLGSIGFTDRAKECLERSLREALALRHGHIGVEHIALALAGMERGLAPRILADIDVNPAQLRAALLERHRAAS